MRIYKESNMIEARHRMLTDNYCRVRFFVCGPDLFPSSTAQGRNATVAVLVLRTCFNGLGIVESAHVPL